MLLRLRFTTASVCCGYAFAPGDELVASSESPDTWYAVHQIAPPWSEVMSLMENKFVEQTNEPFNLDAVRQMIERRAIGGVRSSLSYRLTG